MTPLFDKHIILTSDRLILKPVSEEYKVEICKEFTLAVTKYMPYTPSGKIGEIRSFIDSSTQDTIDGKAIQFCILKKENKEFSGVCGIYHINTRTLEIGLWLKETAQGFGYGTAVTIMLIDFCGKHFEFDYFYYPVDKRNIASRKIPEKLNFYQATTYFKSKNESDYLDIIEYRKNYAV